MAQKFIINDLDIGNEIVMGGSVEYHRELLGKSRTKEKTIGGGWWHWDEKLNKVYFYGSSLDFGRVTKEQFIDAWSRSLISPFIEECEILFSEHEYLGKVFADNVIIKQEGAV